MSLDLGCGERHLDGFVRVDWNPKYEPDYCFDISQGNWPLKSNSFEMIRCDHVFEHLTEIDTLLKEVVRVAKPNAFFRFSFPHYGNAPIEPDHRGRWGLHCLALNPEYVLDKKGGVYVEWSPGRDKGLMYRFVNWLLTRIANTNPYLWERTACYDFGGFSEVVLKGTIVK